MKMNSKDRREQLWINSRACSYCRRLLTLSQTTLDHIVPLVDGGRHNEANTALACVVCNRLKGGEPLTPDLLRWLERVSPMIPMPAPGEHWNVRQSVYSAMKELLSRETIGSLLSRRL